MSTPLFTDKIAEIFVKVDDFCNEFELEFKKHSLPAPVGVKKRNRKTTLSDSEVITLLIAFHGGQFRNFKHFYCNFVCVHLQEYFPNVVSYNRFIELSHRCAILFVDVFTLLLQGRVYRHKLYRFYHTACMPQ